MRDILSGIPLDALRVFEAAARLDSFTRAADTLGMTQAAVSWRIRDLEERLGHSLFVRRPRSISLTEHGERLYHTTGEAMRLLRRGVSDVMETDSDVLGVTTLPTIATQWLAHRLGQFQLANPDLAVRISTSTALSDLSSDGMHVGFRYGSGRWPGMESRFVLPAVTTPICTPALARQLAMTSPEDLKRAPRLGDDREWATWFAVAGTDQAEPASQTRMKADNQIMEAAAATAGQGVALVSLILFQRELRQGLLVAPFPDILSFERGYWLCYPANRRSQPRIARFRDWVLDEARADPMIAPLAERAGYSIGQSGEAS